MSHFELELDTSRRNNWETKHQVNKETPITIR